MITKPIVNIAELTGPEWKNTYPSAIKTNWSQTIHPEEGGQNFPVTSGLRKFELTPCPLYTFQQAYRELKSLSIKRWISPIDNKTMSESMHVTNGRIFTEKINYPFGDSTSYSSYYAKGIYIDDSKWTKITTPSTDYPNNAATDGATGLYWYWINSDILKINDSGTLTSGVLVLRLENESTESGKTIPQYPYTYANWYTWKYTAPQ